jgi:hypothetical protein
MLLFFIKGGYLTPSARTRISNARTELRKSRSHITDITPSHNLGDQAKLFYRDAWRTTIAVSEDVVSGPNAIEQCLYIVSEIVQVKSEKVDWLNSTDDAQLGT